MRFVIRTQAMMMFVMIRVIIMPITVCCIRMCGMRIMSMVRNGPA